MPFRTTVFKTAALPILHQNGLMPIEGFEPHAKHLVLSQACLPVPPYRLVLKYPKSELNWHWIIFWVWCVFRLHHSGFLLYGASEARTRGLLLARQMLSHLSYSPKIAETGFEPVIVGIWARWVTTSLLRKAPCRIRTDPISAWKADAITN